MTGFEIAYDDARGVLTARLPHRFTDNDFDNFCEALRHAVLVARQKGPLRHLSDNRASKAFNQTRAETLWKILAENSSPADRIAVLVSNSLGKVAARKQAVDRGETFASENAALTWLSVGRSLAA